MAYQRSTGWRGRSRRAACAVGTALWLSAVTTATAHARAVIYVDDDAPPGGDGLSWDTAYRFLQDALASNGDEVRVAQGTYRPDRDEETPNGTGDTNAQFSATGILRGGYAGLGAEDPDARDVAAHPTILSGDLLGDDGPNFENMEDNSLTIVRAASVVVDGFTISGATNRALRMCADVMVVDCTFTRNDGGALQAIECSGQAIIGCTFRGNRSFSGGAIYNDQAHPLIEDCVFIDNAAELGGAIYNDESDPFVRGCVFLRNTAAGAGGAAYNNFKSLTDGDGPRGFVDCLFLGNAAGTSGGAAIVIEDGRLFANCVFVGNRAGEAGGALLTFGDIRVTNCSFRDNVAMRGGALRCTAGTLAVVKNSILWRDEPDEISFPDGADVTVRYSIVRGGWSGQGGHNSDESPQYAARPDRGPDGTWGTEDDDYGDLHLTPGSPAIDAAKNIAVPNGITEDLDGNARFVDDPDTKDTGNGDPPLVDMGAYEFQVDLCPGDIDGNGAVDFDDLLRVLDAWGDKGGPEDLDGSGTVDFGDLLIVLDAWGPCE